MTYLTQYTPQDDAKITELWNLGLSTSEIGKRTGRTKNAIIGRAHRLGLSGRQSPILGNVVSKRESVGGKIYAAFQSGNHDLEAFAIEYGLPLERVKMHLWRRGVSLAGMSIGSTRIRNPRRSRVAGATPLSSPGQRVAKLAPVLPVNGGAGVPSSDLTPKMCQFPISDDRPWMFCGCAQADGRPYCAGHSARAYTTWVPKGEDSPGFILQNRSVAA